MVARILCVVILLAGVNGCFFKRQAAADPVRLAQYEVYPLASKKLPGGGFACNIVREAFALHGQKVETRWYPTKRALSIVKKGVADISLGWKKTPERETEFIFSSKPLVESSTLFYFRKDRAFEWNTIEDLKGLRIGFIIGAVSVSDDFLAAEAAGEITVDRVNTNIQNIKKLLAGRIDAMVGSPFNIPYIIKKEFSSEEQSRIVAHPKPLIKSHYYAVFYKQLSPRLIHAFNDGINQLRKSGKYDQLLYQALQVQ